jgi:hypothetical protein
MATISNGSNGINNGNINNKYRNVKANEGRNNENNIEAKKWRNQ